jgi:hypothetical protein
MGFLHMEFARHTPAEANSSKSSTGAFSLVGLDIHASGPDANAPSDCSKRGLAHLYAGYRRIEQLTRAHVQSKLEANGTRDEGNA